MNLRRSASLAVLRTSGPTKLNNISLTFGEHVDRSSFRIAAWLVSWAISLYRDHESSKIIHPLSELSASMVGRVGFELRCCCPFCGGLANCVMRFASCCCI